MAKKNKKADPATCKHPNVIESGQTCEICNQVVQLACKECGKTEGTKMYDELVTAEPGPLMGGVEHRAPLCLEHKPNSNSANVPSN
jgi:hypothetical protein